MKQSVIEVCSAGTLVLRFFEDIPFDAPQKLRKSGPLNRGKWTPAVERMIAYVGHHRSIIRHGCRHLMLRSYIDDSGKDTGPVFVLAGFIASVEQWHLFSREWQAVLDLPPRLPFFSAKQAYSLRGHFFGWSSGDRDVRVNLFIEVVNRHAAYGVYSLLHHGMYEAFFPKPENETAMLMVMRTVYTRHFLNFYGLLQALIVHMAKHEPTCELEPVFDQQLIVGPVKEMLDAVWQGVPDEYRALISWPPRSADDKVVLPLQAADLFAWMLRRLAFDLERGVETAIDWKDILVQTTAFNWTEQDMAKFVNGARRELHEMLVRLNVLPGE